MLNSSSRVDDSVAKLKMRGRAIAPRHPTGKLWEVGAGVVEHIFPGDGVESVGEIQLEEHLVGGLVVPGRPCPDSMNSSFSPTGDSNPEHFANGDGPNPTTRLWDGHQAGPSEEGCHGSASRPIAEEGDDASDVVQKRVGASSADAGHGGQMGLVQWQLESSGAHSSPPQRRWWALEAKHRVGKWRADVVEGGATGAPQWSPVSQGSGPPPARPHRPCHQSLHVQDQPQSRGVQPESGCRHVGQ